MQISHKLRSKLQCSSRGARTEWRWWRQNALQYCTVLESLKPEFDCKQKQIFSQSVLDQSDSLQVKLLIDTASPITMEKRSFSCLPRCQIKLRLGLSPLFCLDKSKSSAASLCERGSHPPSITPPWHTGVRELPAAENNPCRAAVKQLVSPWNPGVGENHFSQ